MKNLARRWMALIAGGALIWGLAACGDDLPDGVDGDLTSGWDGFSEALGFAPEAEVCHAQPYQDEAPLADYQPVDCADPHLVQTVHVGTLPEEAAELEAPPAPDSEERRAAYQECDEQAAEFLGDDFRHGRLWLGVAVPSEAGWDGGARWFRCDLMEVESVYGDPVERSGSLAGALADDAGQDDGSDDADSDDAGAETEPPDQAADPDIRLGCYQVSVDEDAVEEMTEVQCDEPHEAEFVGAWQAPDGPYPDPGDTDVADEVYEGCREQVAAYVDVPVDGDLTFRTGTIADWMSEEDWVAGDRAFRCYLWLPDTELTESLAGAGSDALPVQTE